MAQKRLGKGGTQANVGTSMYRSRNLALWRISLCVFRCTKIYYRRTYFNIMVLVEYKI
jgi:hypothetical protein